MTWSHGFVCPECLEWWVSHICKDGRLPCGCDVQEKDAIYLWRKSYKRGIDIKVDWRGHILKLTLSTTWADTDDTVYVDAYYKSEILIQNKPIPRARSGRLRLRGAVYGIIRLLGRNHLFYQHRRFIFYVIDLARKDSASYPGSWWSRCGRCIHFNRVRPKEACQQGHQWKEITCTDFVLHKRSKWILEVIDPKVTLEWTPDFA